MIRIKIRRYEDFYNVYVNPAAIAAILVPEDYRTITVKLIGGDSLVAVEFDELLDYIDGTRNIEKEA